MTDQPQPGDTIEPEPTAEPQPSYIRNTALLEQVANNIEGVTPEQVAAVLAAYWAIHEGDPVGTIRRDEATGAVGIRVEDNGMHLWRVSTPLGEQYNDLQPKLAWPIIHEPSG